MIEASAFLDPNILTTTSGETIKKKQTKVLRQPQGRLVVDLWPPQTAAATANPILLIHGWGGTGSYWQETARSLARLSSPNAAPIRCTDSLPTNRDFRLGST